jgi:hypothetical protein
MVLALQIFTALSLVGGGPAAPTRGLAASAVRATQRPCGALDRREVVLRTASSLSTAALSAALIGFPTAPVRAAVVAPVRDEAELKEELDRMLEEKRRVKKAKARGKPKRSKLERLRAENAAGDGDGSGSDDGEGDFRGAGSDISLSDEDNEEDPYAGMDMSMLASDASDEEDSDAGAERARALLLSVGNGEPKSKKAKKVAPAKPKKGSSRDPDALDTGLGKGLRMDRRLAGDSDDEGDQALCVLRGTVLFLTRSWRHLPCVFFLFPICLLHSCRQREWSGMRDDLKAELGKKPHPRRNRQGQRARQRVRAPFRLGSITTHCARFSPPLLC